MLGGLETTLFFPDRTVFRNPVRPPLEATRVLLVVAVAVSREDFECIFALRFVDLFRPRLFVDGGKYAGGSFPLCPVDEGVVDLVNNLNTELRSPVFRVLAFNSHT
jgi:hypothetical protein